MMIDTVFFHSEQLLGESLGVILIDYQFDWTRELLIVMVVYRR